MKIYSYSDAQQNLEQILEQVITEGEVRIMRDDGYIFVIKSDMTEGSPLDVPSKGSPLDVPSKGSPLDVPSIDVGLSISDILQFVNEGRRKDVAYNVSLSKKRETT